MASELGTGERQLNEIYSAILTLAYRVYYSCRELLYVLQLSRLQTHTNLIILEDRERAKDFVELHDQVQVRYGWHYTNNLLMRCSKDECHSVG